MEADAKTYAKTFVMVLENNVIELAVVANSSGTVANSIKTCLKRAQNRFQVKISCLIVLC